VSAVVGTVAPPVAGGVHVELRRGSPDDGLVPSIPLVLLPDPEDERCRQAWTDAVADGVPLRLLVDTGTPRSAVPHVEPFATGGRRLSQGGRGAFGVSAEQEVLVQVDALRTGNLVTRHLTVQLQPEGWPHPGLLGMDVLGSHRCDFHVDPPRIDLDSTDPPAGAWHPLPTAPQATPKVRVGWDQTSLHALWDTGAGATLVDQSWARRHPDIVAIHPETGRAVDVTGAEADHHWGTLAPCRIGGAEVASQRCAVVDLTVLNTSLASPVEVVLGMPLIAQVSWCLDFPRGRWALWPSGRGSAQRSLTKVPGG
jgi:hypothetical protein